MGLVRGMARTAVVAGTATAVSNRVSRRQARRWGGQDPYADPGYQQQPPPQQYAAPPPQQYAAPPPQQYAAPPPAAPTAPPAGGDLAAELERLGQLRNQGLLTDDEFNAAKAKLLE
jgi:hypothetical protein